MKRARWIFSISFFLFTLLGTVLIAEEARLQTSPLWREGGSGDGDPDLDRLSKAYVRLADRVRPAIVQVRVSQRTVADTGGESQQPGGSRGSGFIIHPQGYILTAHHVIDGAKEIEIRLGNRQRMRAEVIGMDPQVDIALLKVDGKKDLPIVELGNSDNLKVGEMVGVLGYPYSTESSFSLGVISRRGRSQGPGFDFLQTDAGASSGGSGGPLVNLRGHVVGMITMASQSGNAGFAVPINVIKEVTPRLLKGEKVVWGWLGVRVSEVTLELAKSLGLSPVRGVLVSAVLPGQPAERAGLLPQDVILAVDGIGVDTPREVIRIIGGTEAEKEVKLNIFRKRKAFDLSVRLGAKPRTVEGREG